MASKMGGRKLNERQERFAVEYARSLNATQSYIAAGYKTTGRRTAGVEGRKLLAKPAIQAIIAAQTSKGITAADLTVERVLREVARLAMSDPRKMYGSDGALKPIADLDDDSAAAVASFEEQTTTTIGKAGEDGADRDPDVQRMLRKLKVWDKVSALSLAMRYHGLLRDNVAVTGSVSTAVTYRANMPKRGEEDAAASG